MQEGDDDGKVWSEHLDVTINAYALDDARIRFENAFTQLVDIINHLGIALSRMRETIEWTNIGFEGTRLLQHSHDDFKVAAKLRLNRECKISESGNGRRLHQTMDDV